MAELKPWLEQKIKEIDDKWDDCKDHQIDAYCFGMRKAFVETIDFLNKQQAISAWNKMSK